MVMISTTMKTRILFVDDEPMMLQLMARLLEPMGADWEVALANSGAEALGILAAKPCDVVVSDMRMPGMSGAELFREVQTRQPQTIRIIQSGYADHTQVMQAISVAHQFLTKPFVLQHLLDTLDRIQELNQWLKNDQLRRLVGCMSTLPSMPTAYFRVLEALRSPHASVDDIAGIMAPDPALTAKVLQLVNSAFFGFAHTVASTGEAVRLLGVERIRSLALSAHVFSAFEPAKHPAIPVQDIWAHCFQTGLLAQQVAQHETRGPALLEECFTAGTLHDIGRLILAVNVPDPYRQVLARVRSGDTTLIQAEREAFGASHADVGAFLLGVWGLPTPLVEAVALHHEPNRTRQRAFSPVTAVHVADALAQYKGSTGDEHGEMDAKYLQELGLPASIAGWQQVLCE
jgi:HD-like signal output (HDOD) protein